MEPPFHFSFAETHASATFPLANQWINPFCDVCPSLRPFRVEPSPDKCTNANHLRRSFLRFASQSNKRSIRSRHDEKDLRFEQFRIIVTTRIDLKGKNKQSPSIDLTNEIEMASTNPFILQTFSFVRFADLSTCLENDAI